MTAYSFDKRFVPFILNGSKAQTIRVDRKKPGHVRPGGTLQIFTGLRTRQARLLGHATCASVGPIFLNFSDNAVMIGPEVLQGWEALDGFARQDGFEGWLEMRAFWVDMHGKDDFTGVLIRWKDFVERVL